MSTSYYYLREPITSVRFEERGEHCHISVWEHGKLAGKLIVAKENAHLFAWMFSERESDDSRAPIRTRWGGAEYGCVVDENARGLDPKLQLIDEYGDVWTVADIRLRAGDGRADD
jgi:hypothetical protein